MTVTPSYPGVYVSEVPSGNRTIVGVATSITAFLGRSSRGPAETPVAIANFADYQRTFGDLTRDSGLGYAVRDFYLNGGGDALVVRVVHVEPPPVQAAAGPRAAGPRAAAAAAPAAIPPARTATWSVPVAAGVNLTVTAAGPGAWANKLTPRVEDLDPAEKTDIAGAQGVAAAALFTLIVAGGPGGEEIHRNVTLVDGPRRLDRVLDASALLSIDGGIPDLSAAGADPRLAAGNFPAPSVNGADGGTPNANDYERALVALGNADLVNLVCIPPAAPAGDLPDPVWVKAATFCHDHRAFLLVDPPSAATTPDAVTTWARGNLGLGGFAGYAGLFYPRILRSDPLREGTRSTVVACGAIAGIFARTDASRGVWKAPAGIDAGVADAFPERVLTDDDNGKLNQIGINCLRQFRDTGTVVWGARTRRGADTLADDYKYIPVRRMALFLEETLYRSTQWVVFEPNDEPLWSQIRNSIGTFMKDLFQRGAFQGATPRDAYFVQCGKDTTTQYDIDRGIVNIRVGFAPLKPAEFVMITIQQKAAQPA